MPSLLLPTTTTGVHVPALEGLINVNSLFTLGVATRDRLLQEVVSFSFFLFSSLVAQGLRLAINLLNSNDVDEAFRAKISLKVLRLGMLSSAVGTIMDCLFLMLSMVCAIEIRLGTLSCESQSAIDAVSALVLLVSSALLVYISTAVYSFMQ